MTASQINCGAVASPSCKAFYPTGTQVTLTATPTAGSPGSRFAGWTGGGCSGVVLQCTVDMTHQWDFWPLMGMTTEEARRQVALLPKLGALRTST